MKVNRSFLSLCVAAGAFILLNACGTPAESPALVEARAIHADVSRMADGLHESIQSALVNAESQVDASLQAGDSVTAIDWARIESQLAELDVHFHDWNAHVVGIPGDACTHEHGDDEHAHDHDHGNEQDMEGMTDEQVREIQQALLDELQALQLQYDAIVDTLPIAAAE